MRGETLLDLLLIKKEERVKDVKVGGCRSCSDHEMVELMIPTGKEQGKKQDHIPGLQESRLWPVQGPGRIQRYCPVLQG